MHTSKRNILFGILVLAVLATLVYFRQTETPPEPSTAYPPVTESAPAHSGTFATPPLAILSPTATQTTTTRSSAVSYAKELVWKYLEEPRYDIYTITRVASADEDFWDVSGQFTYAGSTIVRNFHAFVEQQKNGDWWLLGFSWIPDNAPAHSETPAAPSSGNS